MTKFKGKIRVIFMVLHTGRKSPYLGNVKVSKKKCCLKQVFTKICHFFHLAGGGVNKIARGVGVWVWGGGFLAGGLLGLGV